ncbi:MAG: hypothetical protein KC444_08525, partial [Nitrosopumilus sp.]|nr:hypothetical protein [Nitrosopumilus sp.]
MNNEIGRKITSLTLMTIMLAGGMSFAAPSMMPAAFAANANLFVSAENSQFDNYMSGPQVIEVVVIDSDINDTDQGKGEPDVTVNGKKLRMAQAVDGNWYGYFADKPRAVIADGTVGATEGEGLDFGAICTAAEALAATDVDFADTVGVALQRLNANCAVDAPDAGILHVVREAKQLNANPSANVGTSVGQIGVDELGEWPYIQLYTLSVGGNVVVQYNKGGGAQSVTLTYDTVDQYASSSLDRAVYPQGAQVHATITDLWLNVDPTDEDSWTFGTVGTHSTNYQVFDENGLQDGDVSSNTDTNTLTSQLSALMCEDNCVLKFNPDVQGKGIVGTLQDNDDSAIIPATGSDDPTVFSTLGGFLAGAVPVTLTEQGPNSGVFGTYDESDTSNIIITSTAKRGTSASIDYNETPVTILVGHSFAKVDIMPSDNEWNSGEEIPVTLVDGDANVNSRADEDLDVNNPNVKLIPALSTGDPFTLGEKGTGSSTALKAVYFDNSTAGIVSGTTVTTPLTSSQNATVTVQKFSERAILNTTATAVTVDSIAFDYRTTAEDLQKTVLDRDALRGFSLFNLDVRSLNATGPFDVYLLNNTAGNIIGANGTLSPTTFAFTIANGVKAQSLTQLTNSTIDYIQSIPAKADVGLAIVATTGGFANFKDAVVADFFSFGYLSDGLEADERIANQIVRLELEETGDNTSTFAGSLEYVMINQLNILDPTTYTGLSTIADDPSFIVIEDLTDEDSPRVNYNDLGADGVVTQVADQEEAPSHSGVVSFDQSSFKNADTVTITLEDLDLNVDSDLVDIYTTVFVPAGDANNDVVGSATKANGGTSIPLSDGDQLGRLLDVTFDDKLWKTPTVGSACSDALLAITSDTGLAATGFTLIETG